MASNTMIPPLVPPSNTSSTMKATSYLRKARTSSVASMGSIGGNSVASASSCPKQQMIRTSSKADSPYMDMPTSQSRRAKRINSSGGWSASGGSTAPGKTSPNQDKIRSRHCPKELKANSLGGALGKYTFQVLKKNINKNQQESIHNGKKIKKKDSQKQNSTNNDRRRSSSLTSYESETVDTAEMKGRFQRLTPPLIPIPPTLPVKNERSLSATTLSTQGTLVTPTSTNCSTASITGGVTIAGTTTSPTILFPPTIPEQLNSAKSPDRKSNLGGSESVYFDAEEELSQCQQKQQQTTMRSMSSLSLRDSSKMSTTSYPYLACPGFVKDATPSMEDALSDYGLTLFAPLDGAPLRPQPVTFVATTATSNSIAAVASSPSVIPPVEEEDDDESFTDALPSVCTGTATANSNAAVSPTVFRKSVAVPVQPDEDDDEDNNEENSHIFSSSLPQHIVAPGPSMANDAREENSPDRAIHHSSSYHSGSGMMMNMDECLFPVDVVAEPQDIMEDCPRLLSDQVLQYLTEEGLPVVLKMRRWVRAYSLARDGDSFEMMMTLVSPHKFSLLVVKTTRGEVFGGFVDAPWDSGKAFGFYGGGQAFLFSLWQDPTFNYEEANDDIRHVKTSPLLSDCDKRVTLYGWTGANTYFQVCDETKGSFAMGGGGGSGAFGLCVEDCFWKGSTGKCDTFGNAPLAEQSEFEIVDFEVYGFWF